LGAKIEEAKGEMNLVPTRGNFKLFRKTQGGKWKRGESQEGSHPRGSLEEALEKDTRRGGERGKAGFVGLKKREGTVQTRGAWRALDHACETF